MRTLDDIRGRLDERFSSLVSEHGVPGATVAVYRADDPTEEPVVSAAGVVNLETGVEARADSVFQLASITKSWTAVLVMQLVDEGSLDLDEPVRTYLPDFRLADEGAAAAITTRHLLSHSAGFDAPSFIETTDGSDAIARLVEDRLPHAAQLFGPGERFSYNNGGYTLLGRIVEVLRGRPFHRVLREHLTEPLGLRQVAIRPEDAIRFRTAVGHRPDPGDPAGASGRQVVATPWRFPYSNEPAGAMLAMSAPDLLRFGRMLLQGGVASNGVQILSEARVREMCSPHVDVPHPGSHRRSWGLGLIVDERPDGVIVGHDGSNIGQYSNLQIVPEHGVVLVQFCNGGDSGGLFREVTAHVLGELTGYVAPAALTPPVAPPPVDVRRFVGVYRSTEGTFRVGIDENGLFLEDEPGELIRDIVGRRSVERRVLPWSEDVLLTADPAQPGHHAYTFAGDDGNGRAEYLYVGRAIPRVGTGDSS